MQRFIIGLTALVVACSSHAKPANDAGTTDAQLADGAAGDAIADAPPPDAPVNDLAFFPDPGVRIDNASNCKSGIAPDGSVYLYYQDRAANGAQRRAVSNDGLTFPTGSAYSTYENHPSRVQLPNGKWKRYVYDLKAAVFTSESSNDGVTFTPEAGIRYQINAADNGTSGVYDHYVSGTNVIMLYLGDLMGKNNTRAAVSTDEGMSFTFLGTNVLGDDNSGGGGKSFVDVSTIALPSGGRRLFAMRGGQGIYSFTNTDPSKPMGWTQDPGARVEKTSWGDATIIGLFDPTVVRLKDGRYRMYLTAGYAGGTHEAIVSATTK